MSEPQQPEIARARRSAVSQAAAKTKAVPPAPPGDGGLAPVPEDNLPGHHPEVEQDKPTGPPPSPGTRASAKEQKRPKKQEPESQERRRFLMRREEPFAVASRFFGVRYDNAYVDVDAEQLEIRFGPWRLTTPMSNVAGAEVTGPFAWWKVIGPAHLSLKDRGITFATSGGKAVCIRFKEPVPALEPRGLIRHPGATVTVAEPEELVRAVTRS